MYKAILQISLRASLVAAVGFAAYHFVEQFNKVQELQTDYYRSRAVYECASRMSDERLWGHRNEYGLIDLSKVYCVDRPFFASIAEIRDPKLWANLNPKYSDYITAEGLAAMALIGFLLVNITGLGVVIVIAIVSWIGGRETKAALARVAGGEAASHAGLRQWLIPIATGTIATLIGGMLVSMFGS